MGGLPNSFSAKMKLKDQTQNTDWNQSIDTSSVKAEFGLSNVEQRKEAAEGGTMAKKKKKKRKEQPQVVQEHLLNTDMIQNTERTKIREGSNNADFHLVSFAGRGDRGKDQTEDERKAKKKKKRNEQPPAVQEPYQKKFKDDTANESRDVEVIDVAKENKLNRREFPCGPFEKKSSKNAPGSLVPDDLEEVERVQAGKGKKKRKKERQDDQDGSVLAKGKEHVKPEPDATAYSSSKKRKKNMNNGCATNGVLSQPSLRTSAREVEAAKEQASRDDQAAAPAEPAGMEIYWKLASVDATVRESASVALVRELQAVQEAYERGGQKDRVSEQLAEEVLLGAVKDDEGLHDCAPGVRYALRRLVRGVSSSREGARQGFAMALASVLESIPCIKGESILKLIKSNLEVASSMKGQEIRDGLLGQLFAFGAVVRAGRLIGDGMGSEQTNLAREVTELLLSLAKKKSFLREPATAVLLHLIERLPPSSLQDSVVASPLLQEMLLTDPENGNADALLLALRLFDQLPTSLRQSCHMLPDSGSAHDLFLPSHISSIVPLLKDSSSSHPRLHSVWATLVELMFIDSTATSSQSNIEETQTSSKKKRKRRKGEAAGIGVSLEERLASFWSIVVDKALLTSSHERKHMVMELLLLFLPRLPVSSIHIVVSNAFVRCLLDILSVKDSLLYKSAQRCLQVLCQWASEDEHRLVAVVLSLQQSSHGKFDVVSKTHTLKNLLTNLRSKDSCFLFFHSLIDLFIEGRNDSMVTEPQLLHGFTKFENPLNVSDQLVTEKDEVREKDKHGTEAGKSLETQRLWVLDQICSFYRQVQVDQAIKSALQKEVLKFLSIHALFVGSPGTKFTVQELGEEIKWPEMPISENTRKSCLTRLQSLLVDGQQSPLPLKFKKNTLQQDGNLGKNICTEDLKVFFLHFCDLLDELPVVARVQPVSEDDIEAIGALQSAASQLCFAVQKIEGEHKERLQAMCSLLMQLLLQSMTSHVNEVATELIICCKKAFGDLFDLNVEDNGDEQESPALMDVLMDVLLSLLAQSSAPIRAAAEQVFKSFCDDMTESALLSMLRVVKKQLRSARHKSMTALDVEDSDEDPLLGIEDSDEDMDDEEETEVGELDGDERKLGDEADYAEEDSGNDKKNRKSIKEEGLEAKEQVTDNSDSESDLDDEAMFRIDAHLAKILKQKAVAADSGDAKDAQTQLLHFKFRVLSLIEFFVQKKTNSPLAITALPYLLQAFVLSCSVDGSAQLADRIGSILQNKLFKAKQYPRGPDLDKAVVEGLLQRSLRLASRSRVKKVGAVAQACSLWLLKVLHGFELHEGNGDGKMSQIFQDATEDFFVQKKSRLTSSFFREAFMRLPGLGRASLKTLLNKCMSARSEYLQYEALLLVGIILRPKACKELAENKIEAGHVRDFLKPFMSTLSEVLVSLLKKPPNKAARRSEARRFCISILKLLSQQFPEKPVRKLIGESAYDVCLTHLGTSVVESVLKSHAGTAAEQHSKSENMDVGNIVNQSSKLQSSHKK